MSALQIIKTAADSFLPYGHSYSWRPELLWMQAVADMAIALAYFTLPILLFRIARRRRELRFRSVVFCFGAFILANGITHVMTAFNIWHTAFWAEAILKTITAILAIPTAVLLWRSLPDVLSMPSQRQLRDANESLAR